MSKAFRNAVLKQWPSMTYVDHCFIELPVTHIACGFLTERPPGGAYLWQVTYPLYVRNDRITLTFGDRLPRPDGFIADPRRFDRKELAGEFSKRIAPYREKVRMLGELGNFKSYLN
jgi:hypothetical protein